MKKVDYFCTSYLSGIVMKNSGFVAFCLLVFNSLTFSQPIIADHTIVEKYKDIPAEYIAKVKTMLLNIPGESHSNGYRYGLEFLSESDPEYSFVQKVYGDPEGIVDDHLRASGAVRLANGDWHNVVGEEDLWTTQWAVDNFVNTIKYMDEAGNPFSAMGFAWCYDMIINGPVGPVDPVYGCRWSGRSVYYTQIGDDGMPVPSNSNGYIQWGLDSEDSIGLGGPRVTMDMYIGAIEEARKASDETIVFFTTGPVDYHNEDFPTGREDLYQVQVKHDYIREHVKNSVDAVLFDYADILCWSAQGEQRTETWNGHTYQKIHTDYIAPEVVGETGGSHINEEACLRLGKAMWWMLARIAGWDDGSLPTSVNEIKIDNPYSVSPNPVSDRLSISSDRSSGAVVSLIDISGRILFQQEVASFPFTLHPKSEGITPGIYVITLADDIGSYALNFVSTEK